MGKTTSTVTQTQFNSTDLNVDQSTFNNISQGCSMAGSASNIIEIVGSSNIDLSDINQQNELTQMCKLNAALQAQKDAKAAIDLFNKVSAESAAKGGLPLTAADSTVSQDIRNQMSVKLDQREYNNIIQDCTSKTKLLNVLNVVGSKDVKMKNISQTNKALNECLLDYADKKGFTASAEAEAKNESTGKATAEGSSLLGMLGLDSLFTGLFGAAAAPFVSTFLIVCCILVFCCLSMMMMGGSSSSAPAPPPPPRPMQGGAGLFDEGFAFDMY